MNANKKNTSNTWADPDDAPELGNAFFERADLLKGNNLIKRGRPKATVTKQAVTVRYDADVIDAFKAEGPGWQSRMNEVLLEYVKKHKVP